MTLTEGSAKRPPLPPQHLRLMNDDDERFLEVAAQLARLVYRLGLEDDHELLDVGCSVGRLAIGLLTATDYKGRYVGFDITPKQVRWARRHLGRDYENLNFRLVDVRNDRYNPGGTIEPEDFRFPVRANGFHMACLFSIFTHFYREDIERYLHELARVLRPGGTVVATWFLYDDSTLEAARTTSGYPMTFRHDEYTIYNDETDPLRAIAFHEDEVRRMVDRAGLEITTIEHGTWNGGSGPEFQDVVVLRKPVVVPTALQRARSRVARVVRKVRQRSS